MAKELIAFAVCPHQPTYAFCGQWTMAKGLIIRQLSYVFGEPPCHFDPANSGHWLGTRTQIRSSSLWCIDINGLPSISPPKRKLPLFPPRMNCRIEESLEMRATCLSLATLRAIQASASRVAQQGTRADTISRASRVEESQTLSPRRDVKTRSHHAVFSPLGAVFEGRELMPARRGTPSHQSSWQIRARPPSMLLEVAHVLERTSMCFTAPRHRLQLAAGRAKDRTTASPALED
jgi:hypothetical protein